MTDVEIGSLFSGVGGLELGLERGLRKQGINARTVWQVEIDAYCRRVLAKHWPGVQQHDDVTTWAARSTFADIICGGFPCQDISVAGRKAGLAGERSGLWWAMRDVIAAVCPRVVVIENGAHRWRSWVPDVRASLADLGYASIHLRVLACEVGAPHERARVFVVAHTDSERLRLVAERFAGGPPGGVRGRRQAEPRDDGGRWPALSPDRGGGRCRRRQRSSGTRGVARRRRGLRRRGWTRGARISTTRLRLVGSRGGSTPCSWNG